MANETVNDATVAIMEGRQIADTFLRTTKGVTRAKALSLAEAFQVRDRQAADAFGELFELRAGRCSRCGQARTTTAKEKFAIWLHGRGWLVDTCGHEAAVADRLAGATWFGTEDEARAVLASIAMGVDPRDLGTVVTL